MLVVFTGSLLSGYTQIDEVFGDIGKGGVELCCVVGKKGLFTIGGAVSHKGSGFLWRPAQIKSDCIDGNARCLHCSTKRQGLVN